MQDYVALEDLEVGTVLRTYGGSEATVLGLTWKPGEVEVYDIEVEGLHNFFVRGPGSDAPGVLVHNSTGSLAGRVLGALARYPSVPDPRTGRAIPFPTRNLSKVAKADRVSWTSHERGAFIKEWYDRGYATPRGGWGQYDIHHIQPRELGGTNDFWNLVPVQRATHQAEFNAFWREFIDF